MKASLKKTIKTYNQITDSYIKKTKGLELLKELAKFKKFLLRNAFVLDRDISKN